jgi:hypothetical protein
MFHRSDLCLILSIILHLQLGDLPTTTPSSLFKKISEATAYEIIVRHGAIGQCLT